MLISKVGDMESVVKDLKRSIILPVESMARQSMFSEVLSMNSYGIHSQTISSSAVNTLQSHIISRQILAESQMNSASQPQLESRPFINEEPQPIPVRISNGSRGSQWSQGSSNPTVRLTTRINNQSQGIFSSTRCEKKILQLGDSITGGVNTKGLVTSVHKSLEEVQQYRTCSTRCRCIIWSHSRQW